MANPATHPSWRRTVLFAFGSALLAAVTTAGIVIAVVHPSSPPTGHGRAATTTSQTSASPRAPVTEAELNAAPVMVVSPRSLTQPTLDKERRMITQDCPWTTFGHFEYLGRTGDGILDVYRVTESDGIRTSVFGASRYGLGVCFIDRAALRARRCLASPFAMVKLVGTDPEDETILRVDVYDRVGGTARYHASVEETPDADDGVRCHYKPLEVGD